MSGSYNIFNEYNYLSYCIDTFINTYYRVEEFHDKDGIGNSSILIEEL